jgi:hypothetical protein
MSRAYIAFPLVLLILAGCTDSGSGPTPQVDGILLEGKIARNALNIGDTASVVFDLRNIGTDSVTFTFANSCQQALYVRDERSNQLLYPVHEVCLQMIMTFTLGPGGAHTLPLLIHAGTPVPAVFPGLPLPTGHYVAYAKMSSSRGTVQSNQVRFVIR